VPHDLSSRAMFFEFYVNYSRRLQMSNGQNHRF
jgi:hypothetical protein